MNYAVFLPNFGLYGDARTLAQLARDAEAAGWDGFFIWDHIAAWGNREMVDPWVALAAIALQTERVRLGAMITPLARRRPWKVARETVSVDHLSGGRLTLGVGLGVHAEEFEYLGEETKPKARGAMLDEALEVLQKLWTGETITHEGQYYPIKEARFLPRPIQSPRIPVWVGGVWPNKAPLRRAARWDGMFTLFNEEGDAEIESIKQAVAYVQGHRQNDQPFDVVYAGRPTPGDDPAQATEIVSLYAEAGITWWLENITPFSFGQTMEEAWPLEAMHQRILQGPPTI
ncbi:MAG: LLM class flavin-dependent oxidoreductase [Anaerolineae bacterium]|nr:LLM class flavin-dependent oxidoreductase [Anaerolineae bacterium]